MDHVQLLESLPSTDVRSDIPNILHLVWVGNAPIPSFLIDNETKWKSLMPDWTVNLWTNKDLHEHHFTKEQLNLIAQANTGVEKADIVRYFIMEKYGGFYIDADTTPHRSLTPLLYLHDYDILFCHDLEFTWRYMSSGFFAAVPHHPIFQEISRLIFHVELNTGSPHMQTGPRLLGEVIYNVPPTNKNKYGLLPIQYLYRNMSGNQWIDGSLLTEDYENRFGNHFYARMWDN